MPLAATEPRTPEIHLRRERALAGDRDVRRAVGVDERRIVEALDPFPARQDRRQVERGIVRENQCRAIFKMELHPALEADRPVDRMLARGNGNDTAACGGSRVDARLDRFPHPNASRTGVWYLFFGKVVLKRLRIPSRPAPRIRLERDFALRLEKIAHLQLLLASHLHRRARIEIRPGVARVAAVLQPLREPPVFARLYAHVERVRLLEAQLRERLLREPVEVEERNFHLRRQFARLGDIRPDPRRAPAHAHHAVLFGEAAGVRNRRREDRRSALRADILHERVHERLVVVRRGIALFLRLVRVVVPEGDDNPVAGLERIDDLLPAPLGLVAPRAPPADRPVVELRRILHVEREGLSPALLRILPRRVVVAHGRVAGHVDVSVRHERRYRD